MYFYEVISEELEMKIVDLEKTAQDLIQKLGHNFVENAEFNKKDAQENIHRLFELENEHQCALNEKLIINNNQLVALQVTDNKKQFFSIQYRVWRV